MDFYVAIGSLVVLWLAGFAFAMGNLQVLKATKQERLEMRRAEKKIKNDRLRRFYGLDKK
jgi:hypothetical protein